MDPELNKRPLGPTQNTNNTTPTPLGNFDFDREIDQPPAHPGPLLQQRPGPAGKKPGGTKTFFMVLLTILLLAAVAAAGYFYWQTMEAQKQADSAYQDAQTLRIENVKLKSDAEEAKATGGRDFVDQDAIDAVVRARQAAQKADLVKTTDRAIEYIDATFARVVVRPLLEKVNGVQQKGEPTNTYILKKVTLEGDTDPIWAIVVVDAKTAEQQKAATAQFGIPAKVFTEKQTS